MKVVIQRASDASVTVDGQVVGAIGPGLVILLCVEPEDSEAEAEFFAAKIAALRIFADGAGKMNLSIKDVGGAALAVSQFTLAGTWRKGNRPGFSGAAPPDQGKRLYEHFCRALEGQGVRVEKGVFAAHMEVRLTNDGPVTLWMDSRNPQ